MHLNTSHTPGPRICFQRSGPRGCLAVCGVFLEWNCGRTVRCHQQLSRRSCRRSTRSPRGSPPREPPLAPLPLDPPPGAGAQGPKYTMAGVFQWLGVFQRLEAMQWLEVPRWLQVLQWLKVLQWLEPSPSSLPPRSSAPSPSLRPLGVLPSPFSPPTSPRIETCFCYF